jgi:hypothetical protein
MSDITSKFLTFYTVCTYEYIIIYLKFHMPSSSDVLSASERKLKKIFAPPPCCVTLHRKLPQQKLYIFPNCYYASFLGDKVTKNGGAIPSLPHTSSWSGA